MFDHVPEIDTFFDPPEFDVIEKFVEYCDRFGFDVLHSLGTVWDFWAARSTQADGTILQPQDGWDVAVSDERRGDDMRRTVVFDTPGGPLRLVEVYQRTSKYLIVCAPEEYLHQDAWGPRPSPAVHAAGRRDGLQPDHGGRALRPVSGGSSPRCTNGAFNQAAVFRNVEELMTDPFVDEGFYREHDGVHRRLGDPAKPEAASTPGPTSWRWPGTWRAARSARRSSGTT